MAATELDRSGGSIVARLEVLGPCRARADGVELELAPRKPTAVLAVLAASDRRQATDARLLNEIWGRDADRQGLDILKNAVYQLNRRFDVAFGLRPVVHGSGGYTLVAEMVSVDADEFMTAGADVDISGDPEAVLAASERGLALWRGEPFSGFDDLATVDALRRSLASVHDRLRRAWAGAAIDLGRHEVALGPIEELAVDHPDDESVVGLLMRALARSGRQREALRVYEDLRRRLGHESGIEPSRPLNSLYLDILLGRTSEGLIPTDAPATPDAAGQPGARVVESAMPAEVARMARRPFAGRTDELARLVNVTSAPDGTAPAVVVVSGAPGMGKTRLLAAAVTELSGQGRRVRYARCLPDTERAARVVEQLFPDAEGEADLDDEGGASQPDLSDALVDVDMRVGYQQRLAHAAERAHGAVGPEGAVLCIEDAHWIDGGTQAVLDELLAGSMPISLVMTCRPQAIRPTESGDGLDHDAIGFTDLGRWLDGRTWEELPLGPLDDAAVLPLVQAVLPMRFRHRAPATVELVQRQARGIPLLVAEVLSEIEREVASTRTFSLGAIEAAVPDDLQGSVERTMVRLTAAGRDALKATAVGGMRADLDLVAAVLDLDEDAVAAALEEAVSEGLITDRTGRLGEYQFTHDLHRSAVLSALGVNRRVRLHRRYAEVIAARRGRSGVRDRATHLMQAVPLVEGAVAVDAALEAAQVAVARFDVEDAVRLLHRAHAVMADTEVSAGLRCDVLMALAALEAWIGEREAARSHFSAALAITNETGDVERRARLLLAVEADSRIVLTLADRRELLVEVNELLGGSSPTPLSISVQASLLGEAVMPGRFLDTGIDAMGLVRAARAVGDRRALTDALFAAHVATRGSADLAARARLAHELVELAGDVDAGSMGTLEGLGCRIYDLVGGGRFDEAATATQRMADIARERSVARFAWRAKVIQSALLRARGANAEADALAAEALVEGKGVGGADANAVFAMQTHDSLRHQGALASLVDALRLAAGQTDVVVIHLLLAQALAHADDLDAARREWKVWGRVAMELPHEDLWLPTKALAAELVATGVGDAGDAGPLTESLLPFTGQWVPVGIPVATWGPVDAYLGLLTRTGGDQDEADHLLARAATQCRMADAAPWSAWVESHAQLTG